MKKLAALVLLFVSVNVFAQKEAGEDTASTPVITAIGKPKGKKTEIKINKDGGSLKSSDGVVELIFPAGAISKKTGISIQPITNLMTNGDGMAYRFEPSGIQFQKPVRVIFHYDDDEEIKDSVQLLLGIAMQDDKGQWYSLKTTALDTVSKTISGNINHFSDWGKFRSIKLYPSYARVKVKKQLTLTVDLIANEEEDLLTPLGGGDNGFLSALKKRKIPWRSAWRATSGEITRESKTTATYTAPASPPPRNPAAITVDLNGLTYTTKVKGESITFKDLKLVSNVLIFDDAYEVTMISEAQDPGTGSSLGAVTYRDTGSFVVSLNGREARIIERVNKNVTAALEYSGGCCYNYRIVKTGTGNIHIAGTPVIKVTPAAVAGNPSTVELSFSRVPSVFPLFNVTCQCPGDKSPSNFNNGMGVSMMAGILPAFPIQIKFEAKEGEHVIFLHGEPGGPLYAKFTVKQLKENE